MFKSVGENRLWHDLDGQPPRWKHDDYRNVGTTLVGVEWDLKSGDQLSLAEQQIFDRYLAMYRDMFERYVPDGNVDIVREYRRLAKLFGWVPLPRAVRK